MAAAQRYSDVLSLRSGHLSGHFLWKDPLVHVKVLLIMKIKTIAKGKCFGSPARQWDSLVIFLRSVMMTNRLSALHFQIFSGVSLCWSLLPIVKRFYPWLCQCGLLKHFEILIIYQSALHTDGQRPGFILMAVFTFQVVGLKSDYDGST